MYDKDIRYLEDLCEVIEAVINSIDQHTRIFVVFYNASKKTDIHNYKYFCVHMQNISISYIVLELYNLYYKDKYQDNICIPEVLTVLEKVSPSDQKSFFEDIKKLIKRKKPFRNSKDLTLSITNFININFKTQLAEVRDHRSKLIAHREAKPAKDIKKVHPTSANDLRNFVEKFLSIVLKHYLDRDFKKVGSPAAIQAKNLLEKVL